MKKTLLALSLGMMVTASASAGVMYINLGTNDYDTGRSLGMPDTDFRTANFQEFGYNQILATSIYDMSDGSVMGGFYDTNVPTSLAAAGVPTSGLALDGVSTVNLVLPDCPNGQCDIDGLSPLVPPLGSNNEGFLQTWDLQVLYTFIGTLTAGGPVYTGGTFQVYFNDLNDDSNDRKVIEGTLTGSTINIANLDLFFDITWAEDNWLWIDNGSGTFFDAADFAATDPATLHLDTNVSPPIPTDGQLLLVGNNAIRQTTLDGSITGQIPEPGTLALLGIGLAGIGFVGLRRKQV